MRLGLCARLRHLLGVVKRFQKIPQAPRARNRVPRHLRHPVVFAQQRQVLQAVAPRRVQKHQRLHVLARGESARPLLDPYVPIAQAGQAQTAQHPAYGA